MKHGRKCEHVKSVSSRDSPQHLWRVSCWIPEGAEQALHQRCDAGLLGSLPIGGEAVEHHTRARVERAGCVYQRSAIAGLASEDTQLVSDALGSLQDGVKVVPLHEFGATEAKDVWVNISARQLFANVVGTPLRLGESSRGWCAAHDAVLPDLQA